MDLKTAMARSRKGSANLVGLQLCGPSLEVFRPRLCGQSGQVRVERRTGALFDSGSQREMLSDQSLPPEARDCRYFEAPLSDEEFDRLIEQGPETMLHRLLKGAPDPQSCQSPRDKAAFTSWCIATLAHHNP